MRCLPAIVVALALTAAPVRGEEAAHAHLPSAPALRLPPGLASQVHAWQLSQALAGLRALPLAAWAEGLASRWALSASRSTRVGPGAIGGPAGPAHGTASIGGGGLRPR